jgi:hypothetical protein
MQSNLRSTFSHAIFTEVDSHSTWLETALISNVDDDNRNLTNVHSLRLCAVKCYHEKHVS